MELQECVDKLEQKFDAIATSQKERRCHITERLEKMTEQLSSKSTPEMGENSAPGTQQFQKKSAQTLPQKTTRNLTNFIPKTVKLDFPRYDGKEDPVTWVSRAERYFMLHEIAQSDKVTLASFSVGRLVPNTGNNLCYLGRFQEWGFFQIWSQPI